MRSFEEIKGFLIGRNPAYELIIEEYERTAKLTEVYEEIMKATKIREVRCTAGGVVQAYKNMKDSLDGKIRKAYLEELEADHFTTDFTRIG